MKIRLKTYLIIMMTAVVLLLFITVAGATKSQINNDDIHLPIVLNNFYKTQILVSYKNTYSSSIIDDDGSGNRWISISSDCGGQTAEWSPDGTKIVFTSASGNYCIHDIYLINPDGSNLTKLTNGFSTHYASVSWSPDGSQIAFTSNPSGYWEVYSMDADGNNITQLTSFANPMSHVKWSPAGNKIAFQLYSESNKPDLYIMDVDGSNQENLATGTVSSQVDWSPDGLRILFIDYEVRNLFMVDIISKEVVQLTDTGHVASATWSPGGEKIAYSLYSTVDEVNAFMINSDGSNKTPLQCGDPSNPDQVINHAVKSDDLSWSPDGKKIAYSPLTCESGYTWTDCGLMILDLPRNRCYYAKYSSAEPHNPRWRALQFNDSVFRLQK